MRFKNNANNYVEEISDMAWLWCLLFAPIYFAIKGVWSHAIISVVLAIFTGGISWLIYPFLVKGIFRKHYLKSGWIEIT